MGFSAKQLTALKRNLNGRQIRTRKAHGRELSYIEGWFAISEANRIFGFDGWSRETLDSKCVLAREIRGAFTAVYTAKVRITVQADGLTIIREGHGSGEGHGVSPGEIHDIGLKAAETDATKRALATFGRPFGLALYRQSHAPAQESDPKTSIIQPTRFDPKIDPSPAATGTPPLTPTIHLPEGRIDKSALALPEPKRRRDKSHLRFVAEQPCVVCGRQPSDPHHLRFAQPRALGIKVSDEFTVPLCRAHHRHLHQTGVEVVWWDKLKIDALRIARELWEQTHPDEATGPDQLGVAIKAE